MVTAVSRSATASVPAMVVFEQNYPGTADQVKAVRADLELNSGRVPGGGEPGLAGIGTSH